VKQYVSCALKINGMQREIYFLPKIKGKARSTLSRAEEDKHVMDIYTEIDDLRKKNTLKSSNGSANQFLASMHLRCQFNMASIDSLRANMTPHIPHCPLVLLEILLNVFLVSIRACLNSLF
jgi:hypothetical protein